MALASRVLRAIRTHGLIDATDRVAVALSGGPDSVALLWLLRELAAAGDGRVVLAGLIHVNHGLRGEESARDETFCRRLADRVKLPIEVAHVDVAAAARAAHRSIEATARDLRYRCFADAAARLGATRVATGHTMDDQAETVLLRLLRGAGSRGLSGIRVKRGLYIRPLLSTRRAELGRYLSAHGEAFCEDSSNASTAIARNRVRHELMPVVERLAPGAVAALARSAAHAAADDQFLEAAAIKAAVSIVQSGSDGVQLDQAALVALAPALARRVVRAAIERVCPGRTVAAAHLEAVRALAAGRRTTGQLDLPGLRVERHGPIIRIVEAAPAAITSFDVPLPVPGTVDLPGIGRSVSASVCEHVTRDEVTQSGPAIAVVQASSVALPLRVRSRHPGDRLRPLGAPGRRKVQDVLVDRKVPRRERDRVPIVVDADGRLVWLVGLTIAEECRVTSLTAGVVILRVLGKGILT